MSDEVEEPRDWYVSDMSEPGGFQAFGPMTKTAALRMVAEASPLRQGRLWAHDNTVRRNL